MRQQNSVQTLGLAKPQDKLLPSNKAIKQLLKVENPTGWKEFVFDFQNVCIASGLVEEFTQKGREDFSKKCSALYKFFSELDSQQQKS